LGSGLKIVLSALLVCALGLAATASAAKPKPKLVTVYRVTVSSTYVHHHTITLVGPKSPNTGCSQRYDVDATQTITLGTTTPIVRTLAQLNRGDFPALRAHEVRNGTGRDGWEPGCPALADDPAELEDTTGCGAQDYSVATTSLGYLAATGTRFAFTYRRHAADPYEGNCFAGVFLDPNSDDLAGLVRHGNRQEAVLGRPGSVAAEGHQADRTQLEGHGDGHGAVHRRRSDVPGGQLHRVVHAVLGREDRSVQARREVEVPRG
jgi:hypothetical protein